MDLVFTVTAGVQEKKIKDSNFCDHYPDIAADTAWNYIKPHIRQATKLHVIPYLGQDFYDELVAVGSPSTEQSEALEMLRDTVAWYTMYEALPSLNLAVGDGAVKEVSTEKSMAVSQWRFKNSLFAIMKKADAFMDRLLEYLEEQVEASNADFDTWKNSDEYTEGASNFFRTTKELSKFIKIRDSRRAFLVLLPYIEKAEKKYLESLIGPDLYNKLIAETKANNLTTANEALMKKVRPMLAEFALYLGIPHLRLELQGDGIFVISSIDGADLRRRADDNAVNDLRYSAEADGRQYRSDLIQFLYDNEDDYPLWKDSDYYDEYSDSSFPVKSEDQVGGIFL